MGCEFEPTFTFSVLVKAFFGVPILTSILTRYYLGNFGCLGAK